MMGSFVTLTFYIGAVSSQYLLLSLCDVFFKRVACRKLSFAPTLYVEPPWSVGYNGNREQLRLDSETRPASVESLNRAITTLLPPPFLLQPPIFTLQQRVIRFNPLHFHISLIRVLGLGFFDCIKFFD
jgi:hypothetical protein